MGLGTITDTTQGVRAIYAPASTAWNPSAAKRSDRIPDDDSAVARIRNLNRAEDSGIIQTAADSIAATLSQQLQQFAAHFSESLGRYKEMSEKIASGRFSPTTLREQAERLKEAAGMPGADHPDENSISAFSGSGEFKSASRGATDTRALVWLKDQAQGAMCSQSNVEPGRVLALLREMISPNTAGRAEVSPRYGQ